MNNVSLSDAELVLMEILWNNGCMKARDIAVLARQQGGWEKNTVYTMLGRLIDKNAVIRSEPGFVCKAAVEKSEISRQQTRHLLNRMYNGSARLFLRAFIREQDLSDQDMEELKRIIDEQK